jgi:predicted SnoaL-like aldol condensation-catalyzing enzyme
MLIATWKRHIKKAHLTTVLCTGREHYFMFVKRANGQHWLSSRGDIMKVGTATSRKEVATSFLQLVASGRVSEAYQSYIAPNFRHHNPFFRGDADSLRIGMEEDAAKHPDKVLEFQHALEDGDLVAVHSQVRQSPDDRGAGVVHIFRFQRDRIVELWDLEQPVPEDSPNQMGCFK